MACEACTDGCFMIYRTIELMYNYGIKSIIQICGKGDRGFIEHGAQLNGIANEFLASLKKQKKKESTERVRV